MYVLSSEAKQQMSLTEWCDVKAGVSQRESQRKLHSASVLQDTDLLDNGGDSVFSQMVIFSASSVFFSRRSRSVNHDSRKMNYFCLYFQSEKDVTSLEPWLLREMDNCISSIFLQQDADAFVQLFNLIVNENVSGAVLVDSLTHTHCCQL